MASDEDKFRRACRRAENAALAVLAALSLACFLKACHEAGWL